MAAKKQYPAKLLKEFWNDESVWGEDGYVADLILLVNNVEVEDACVDDLKDSDVISIEDGYIIRDIWDEAKSVRRQFSAWLKKRSDTHVNVLIQVDKTELDALREAIAHIRSAKIVADDE